MLTNRPRILIADDHTLVADLCKKLLETDYEVVGMVTDGCAMVRVAQETKPDIVLVDIGMPVLNGLDAGQQVKKIMPAVKLIFLTMNSDIKVVAEAFRRGASGYLLKTCGAPEMITAIREVLRGNSYISRSLCKDDITYHRRMKTALVNEDKRLTPRQQKIVKLVAEGKTMSEIGCILNLSTRTVAYHKYNVMEIHGIKSDAELVRYAIRHHVIRS